MKPTKRIFYLIALLLVLLTTINYSWIDSRIINSLSDYEIVNVERIIDGDTIKSNGTSIRLLGINSPEKKEPYYQEAKNSLEKEILNKTVRLEYGRDKKDRYNRTLAYVFLNGENINLEQVRQGFANYYFPSGKDIYYNNFKKAWERCIAENKNLCESSKNVCSQCIELKELNFETQEIVLFNKCEYECNLKEWTIKDEGRKKFIFPEVYLKENAEIKIIVGEGENNQGTLYWQNEEYVWTKTGDTLFLRDDGGKLVLWKSY